MNTRPATAPFDHSLWPIVRFVMPETVPDAAASAQLAEFEALLAPGERFVLVASGPVVPVHSKRFMQLYTQWTQTHRAAMARLCAGFIRLEPDHGKRAAYQAQLAAAAERGQLDYPALVAASEADMRATAARLLAMPAP